MVEIYAVHRDEGWENAGEQAVSGVIFWDNGADLLIAAPARIAKDAEALKATFSDNFEKTGPESWTCDHCGQEIRSVG